MRILLITATGQLGSRLYEALLGAGFSVVPGYHSRPVEGGVRVDLSEPETVAAAISAAKPDVVVVSAAMTDVDGCERGRDTCMHVNCLGPAVAAAKSPWTIYISTDYVFDGERGWYVEEDRPRPIQWYGISKLCGEYAVTGYSARWTIIRPSTLFGLGGSGKPSFAEWVLRQVLEGREVRAFADLYSTPTYVESLAQLIVEVLERGVTGLWHWAGTDRVSRYEWALLIARRLGREDLVKPASTSEALWAARRPRDSSLSIERARRFFKTRPMGLSEAVDDMLRRAGLR